MTFTITAVSGSLRTPSTTTALLGTIVDGLQQAAGESATDAEVIELSTLALDLAQALTGGSTSPELAAALERIRSTDLLVVGTPIYRGAYSGLFKQFFDLVGQNDLAGTPVLVTAGGGNDLHSLAIDHSLRPLFAFFEAPTLALSVYSRSADFTDGQVTGEALRTQIDRAVTAAAPLLRA